MLKKFIFIILIFAAIVVLPVSAAKADVVTNKNAFVYVYLFHLYYDNGQLNADRDAKFKYDIIAESYTAPTISTTNPYRGEILNFRNDAVASFKFNIGLVKGRLSVKGPYFADAQKVNFYDDKGRLLLTLDVSGSSFCNDDGVCNSNVGENYDNCPADCKIIPTPSPSASQPPAPSVWQSMLMPILIGAAVAVAALVIWIIIRKRRSSAGYDQNLPPPAPPSTPPAP